MAIQSSTKSYLVVVRDVLRANLVVPLRLDCRIGERVLVGVVDLKRLWVDSQHPVLEVLVVVRTYYDNVLGDVWAVVGFSKGH